MRKQNPKSSPKAPLKLEAELARARKKIEALEWQAQIEAALECVRARAMAMHRSEELPEVATVMFREFRSLTNIETGTGSGCWISIIDAENEVAENWGTDFDGEMLPARFRLPQTEHPVLAKNYKAWKRGKSLIVTDLSREAFIDFTQYISRLPDFATDPVIREALANPPERYLQYEASFSHGVVGIGSVHPFEKQDTHILLRFAKVFEMTYCRFLDLKQAEAQAREAQIEAALERVRARTMAMHKSDELQAVVRSVFERLNELSIEFYTAIIIIFTENSRDILWWLVNKMHQQHSRILIKYAELSYFHNLFEAKKNGKEFFSACYSGAEKKEFYNYLLQQTDLKYIPEEQKQFLLGSEFATMSVALTKNIGIHITRYSEELFSEKDNETLRRFARVLDQAYVRFLDLQQAEAQAREAQIEAALERVRASTMAMHKSDELRSVIAMVFEQLKELGFEAPACGLIIFEENGDAVNWLSGFGKEIFPVGYHIPHFDHPYYQAWLDAWKSGEPWKDFVVEGDLKRSFDQHLFQHSDFKNLPDEIKGEFEKIDYAVSSNAFMSHGMLGLLANEPIADEQKNIIKRFANVFDQTYTRFLDLQKAEERAREAEIEAALERVRARAMAMHHSDELAETAAVLFQELDKLDIKPWRCGFVIIDEETATAETRFTTAAGQINLTRGSVRLNGHAIIEKAYAAWKLRDPVHIFTLSGKALLEFMQYLLKHSTMSLPEWESGAKPELPTQLVFNYFNFSRGIFNVNTPKPLEPEAVDVLQRFTRVFELTYTRFEDLQHAEARAREAEQQASLDRVRAEIASMRNTDDLQRITPLIWRELTALGVPFFRCGIFIIEEATGHAHVYLSTPSGEAFAVLHFKFNSTPMIEKTVQHWRLGEVYRDEWDRQRFEEWTQSILEQGFIDSPEQYQAGSDAPEKLALQLVPFTQGMLYVGSTSPLSDDEINLTKRLADAFSVAYARYEDFQKLEAAKAKVDTAFSELGILSKELEAKNKELEAENLRKARELEEARRLQLAMLPKTTPKLPHLDIAVYMQAATEVGGDYYDFKLENDGTLTAVIGDATGHGLQAGLMVATAKGLFNSLAHEPDLVQILQKSSAAIKAMGLPRLYMAMTIAKFKDSQMHVAAAGMPYALIYRAQSGRVEEVVLKGMPLGSFPDFPYQQKNVSMNKGDTVLFVSDGLEEMFNEKGETLGDEQVKTLFAEAGQKSPAQIIEHLQQAGAVWAGVRPQIDDVTMVVMRKK